MTTLCKDMCGISTTKEGILTLLDGNEASCVEPDLSKSPHTNFIFGILNKENLSSLAVSVLAKQCVQPYLSLLIYGSCNFNTLIECKLVEDITQANGRMCKFQCLCIEKCDCLMVQIQSFKPEDQVICEISIT